VGLNRCIIHIGAGKTGSSSIQGLLAASPEPLAEQGVAFLGRMVEQHKHLQQLPCAPWQRNGGWPQWLAAAETLSEAYAERLEDQLNALEERGIHTVIISNEGLLRHVEAFRPVVERLAERGLAVDAVAVLRRHYEWAFSAYVQWAIRHKTNPGRVLSFRQWLDLKPPCFGPPLQAWRDCPGVRQLLLINYSAVDDVVPAFLNRLGLQLPYPDGRTERANPAASLLEALVLATYNDHQDGPAHPTEANGLLERLQAMQHVGRADTNLNWPGTQDFDLQELVAVCAADLAATNGLLEADGQPPFADAEQQPPMIPSSLRSLEISSQSRQDELLAALLSIVIHMDQELRAQQQVLAQVRRKLRQQST